MADPFVAELPTCKRCGIFLKPDELGRVLCGACSEHDVIASIRGPLSAGLVARGVGSLVARIGLHAAWITVLFSLPGFLIEHLIPDLPFAFQMLNGAITLAGELAVMVLANDVLRGREVDVGRALGDGLYRYGAAFVTRWLAGLFTLLWLALLVLPGLYKAAAYTLAAPMALFEETSGADAIDQSIERTRPHMTLILVSYGLLTLLFVGWLSLDVLGYVLFVGEARAALNVWLVDGVGAIGLALIVALATLTQMVFYVKLSPAVR